MKFLLILLIACMLVGANHMKSGFKILTRNGKAQTLGGFPFVPRSIPLSRQELKPPKGSSPDDFFKFIPEFIGFVKPNQTLNWDSTCFKTHKATLTGSGSNLELKLVHESKKSLLCQEFYLIADLSDIKIAEYVFSGTYKESFGIGYTAAELYDIENVGLRVFKFKDGKSIVN
jgi:hypothetical protein